MAVGDDLRKAVKFASAAGALACTKFGAVDAMPTNAEIIELMQNGVIPPAVRIFPAKGKDVA